MKKPHLLFLTLKVFSATGGIEKVSRVAARALHELCAARDYALSVLAAWDPPGSADPRYLPPAQFRGFGKNKPAFVLRSLRLGREAAVVLLSHANLLPVGYAIKKLSPGTKIILLAHGIEVWSRWPVWKRAMLQACDAILPVSRFTANRLVVAQGVHPRKLQVLHNCLDPLLQAQRTKEDSTFLRKHYGFAPDDKIVLTVTRLAARERYKGYDAVLLALKRLRSSHPHLRYLVVGRYDEGEKARLDRLVRQQGLEGSVVFAGFVPDDDLAVHFALADVYVMPSRGEGFGIVFLEALYYGLPVIAGGVDGSPDALDGGRLGILVDPGSPAAISGAILEAVSRPAPDKATAARLERQYGFPAYKIALQAALQPFLPPVKREPAPVITLSPGRKTRTWR